MKIHAALLCLLGVTAGANALACYTVYDSSNRVAYRGEEAPVDMSLPLHVTLPQRFPGGHMVFDLAGACPVLQAGTPVTMQRQPAGSAAPLLTDTATAQALRLPHTNVAGNIAMVPAGAAANIDLPTFTVVPSGTTVAMQRSPTQAMGAGPSVIRNADGSIASLQDTPAMGVRPRR